MRSCNRPRATPSDSGGPNAVRPARAGFTLVEIMVVVTIISLLVAAAVPAAIRVKRRSLATAVANDLRVFAAAFDAYAHEKGTWPAESDPGVVPTGMESRIKADVWQRTTPIGGKYNWDNAQMHAGARPRAAIAISTGGLVSLVQDLDRFEAVDQVIDDGNLATGNFRLGANDEPVFIIAP